MTASAKNLKVLMIGNSFSICVGKNLPHLAAYEKKHDIELTSAYIGGCTLDRHVENLRIAEADPNAGLYLINTWTSKDLRKKGTRTGNVNELLKNNKYDIVTIQQGSQQSWDHKFYQPYADELTTYIKKYNPQAEIVIQQTWAYRADSPLLKTWGFDQKQMSEKVINAYKEFAKETGFRIIPTGRAVEIARQYPEYRFTPYSGSMLEKYVCPDLPPRAHDVAGKHFWRKSESGVYLDSDQIHLNEHGEYLQACVWYAFLFGEDAEKIKYEPELAPESCKILRSAAAAAVAEYR